MEAEHSSIDNSYKWIYSWGLQLMLKHLPGNPEALGSIPSTTEEKEFYDKTIL